MEAAALSEGCVVTGLIGTGPATVIAVSWHGSDSATVIYRTPEGALAERVVFDLSKLNLVHTLVTSRRPFAADGASVRRGHRLPGSILTATRSRHIR